MRGRYYIGSLGSVAAPFALEPLPDWWPEEPVYHGTRYEYLASIQRNGLCAPPAWRASGDNYGWAEVWRHEVAASYRELTAEQRRKLNAHLGLPAGTRLTQKMLGQAVSLWWVSKDRRVAESYEVVNAVDLSQLNYFWWFPDTVLGQQSYVFVLPTACPQAPGTVLRPLKYAAASLGKYGYISLRQWVRNGARGPVGRGGWFSTQKPIEEDDTVFFQSEQGAYRVGGGPVAKFPRPPAARLLDARNGVWATKAALTPGPGWYWHDERVMATGEGPYQPMFQGQG